MVDSDIPKKNLISDVFLPSNFILTIIFLTSFVNSFDYRPMMNDTFVYDYTRMQTKEVYKFRHILARDNSPKVSLHEMVFIRSYFPLFERDACR